MDKTNSVNWLQLASDAYDTSTSYVDANYRREWENCLTAFQSKHAPGSKYNSELYAHRSRIFRPKTRAAVRKNEASAAAAFFANSDVTNVEAVDQSDSKQAASAALTKELLNHRLTVSIPWFITLLGAFQDAMVQGVVVSHQYWCYRDIESKRKVVDEFGQETTETVRQVVDDKPVVDLIPVENIRIDPGSSWTDPINSSPYVIWLIPMYVGDIKERATRKDSKTGQAEWFSLSDDQIAQSVREYDSTASVRDRNKEDRVDVKHAYTDFSVAWVHMNIVRRDGEDWIYYTLGTNAMLSKPQRLKEVYFTGQRPFVMGMAVMESHRPMPSSYVHMGLQLQNEANEIANQRLDNVKLVLNKRWIVRRGAQVDVQSLLRNVPGAITMAGDVGGDIRELNWPDVTSSSYAEQDRVSLDMDELLGNFSQSSVMTNRKLNETVGGMGMMSDGASQMTEYLIRTFTETWVEPVLRQLVKLEQAYETDETILAIAAKKADVLQKYGISGELDSLLNQDLIVRVNVGMGATDPSRRIQRVMTAVNTFSQAVANLPPGANLDEIGKEIFAAVGYKDGARFFDTANPRKDQAVQNLQGQMQGMAQEADAKMAEKDAEIAELKKDKGIDMYEAQTKRIDVLVKSGVPVQIAVPMVMGTMAEEQARMEAEQAQADQMQAAQMQQMQQMQEQQAMQMPEQELEQEMMPYQMEGIEVSPYDAMMPEDGSDYE